MTQLATIGILVLAALSIRAAVLGLAWLTDLWVEREWQKRLAATANTPEMDAKK